MSDSRTERYEARQRERTAVVWGCEIHRTPAGENCRGCADQGDLFSRNEVPQQRTWRRE
jgi:hypothetical protein